MYVVCLCIEGFVDWGGGGIMIAFADWHEWIKTTTKTLNKNSAAAPDAGGGGRAQRGGA